MRAASPEISTKTFEAKQRKGNDFSIIFVLLSLAAILFPIRIHIEWKKHFPETKFYCFMKFYWNDAANKINPVAFLRSSNTESD